MRLTLLSLSFATALSLATAAIAQDPAPVAAPAPMAAPAPAPKAAPAAPRDANYNAGLKALDEGRWADAVSDFDKSAASAPSASGSALYWKAYSLAKLTRMDEANATCDQLRSKHPDSSWNRECSMLKVQGSLDKLKLKHLSRDDMSEESIQRTIDNAMRATEEATNRVYMRTYDGNYTVRYDSKHVTSEDDIKILALNSLMRSDPEKALPLLHDLILSDKPIAVRKEALFVLSRSKQPGAQAMLLEIAKSTKDPVLQHTAIETLSISSGKDAGPTLVEIYKNSTDASVKRAAINGLFISRDATRLVDIARAEKDLNLKRDIVSQLALMKDPVATDYMLELLK